jgi:hypothetical protein
MRGDTSRIDIAILKIQWASHSSYASLCTFWTVSRDQLVRLRDVIPLAPRHDRRLRYKPPRPEKPTAEELAASEATLSLAPMVAARATNESSLWTDEIREQRRVQKAVAFRLAQIDVPEELRDLMDDEP